MKLPRAIVIQEHDRIDNITSDGTPLYQKPYPLAVNGDGTVRYFHDMDIEGLPYRIVGFARDAKAFGLDYAWHEIVRTPAKCIGMYVISADYKGTWATHLTAVASAEWRTVSPERED